MFKLLFIITILAPLAHSYAGAWTVEAGKWEHYHDVTYYSTNYYYDNDGKRHDQKRYTKLEKGQRFEYGWIDGLTIGTAATLAAVKSTASTTNGNYIKGWNYGLVDPQFYLRQRFWQDEDSVISAQATLKLPSLFAKDTLAHSGSDKTSFELRLLAGHNFSWLDESHFSNFELAYEKRPWNDADLIHADATAGFHVHDSLTILPQIFSTWSASGSNTRFTQTGNDSYDLLKGQLSAVFPLTDIVSMQAGGFHTIYGRNTGGGSGATISLWVKP